MSHEPVKFQQCLLHVWHAMDQSVIDNAIVAWRLRACVKQILDTLSNSTVVIITMSVQPYE